MDIIKVIDRDIAEVKERIDNEVKDGSYKELFDGDNLENADEVLELVNQWENLDDALSYDAGYIAGLEAFKRTYQNRYKLKSLLAKVKSVFAKKNRNNISLDLNE
jgi:hypothetical protein